MRKIARLMLIMLIAAVCIIIPTSESNAAEAEKDIVYTDASNLNGNFDQSGTGTKSDPYKLFEKAFENVKDGGTIYIINKAFLNTDNTSNPVSYTHLDVYKRQAIDSVLNYKDTENMFFYATPEGEIIFSKTNEEHNKAIEEHPWN